MGYVYYLHRVTKTPQKEPIPGRSDQVQNNAGGYVFKVDPMMQLRRFLALGTEGGTYYVGEREITLENIDNIIRLLNERPKEVLNLAAEMSSSGRIVKNDPAIVVLALGLSHKNKEVRVYAASKFKEIVRIPTHLFTFASYIKKLRGWGRLLRETVADWYLSKNRDNLVYHILKYQQRGGWTHLDLLRLAHVKPKDEFQDRLFGWLAEKKEPPEHPLINAFVALRKATKVEDVLAIIKEYNVTWEFVPTQWLKEPAVWKALLPKLPFIALVRNLARMSACGLLKPFSDEVNFVVEKITNPEIVRKSKIHPIQAAVAAKTYGMGRGIRGKLSWPVDEKILDALNELVTLSFGNVEKTGKRFLLALDVSGSMVHYSCCDVLNCMEGAAIMALATVKAEDKVHVVAFSDGTESGWVTADRLVTPFPITRRSTINSIYGRMRNLNFGATDCALPMLYATKNKIPVDVFVTFCVDEETEILTSSGWKKYYELKEGDEVYTLNHDLGVGEWQQVERINIFPPAERSMILMEGRAHSSLTTLNHRWPVCYRGNSTWGRRWKTTETLNMVDYIQCAAVDNTLPSEKRWSDDFVELVAWAWTEGYWDISNGMSIIQSETVNYEYCQRIEKVLRNLFGDPVDDMRHYKGSGEPKWTKYSRRKDGKVCFRLNQASATDLAKVMNRNKVVSLDWLRQLTLDQLKLFIDVSMMADGHIERHRLFQVDSKRAESFAFACILAGLPVSYTKINNEYNNGLEIGILRRKQFAPLQHAFNSDGRSFTIQKVKHNGIVWCPTTPNGTWLARRNGSVYWTGNTDNETWYGKVHPCQALEEYRQKMGIPAKLAVVGMVATKFSIADPEDPYQLDFVGFDTATPQAIAEFAKL